MWQKTQGKAEQGILHLRGMEDGVNLEVSVVQQTGQLMQHLGSDLGFNFSVARNILSGFPNL